MNLAVSVLLVMAVAADAARAQECSMVAGWSSPLSGVLEYMVQSEEQLSQFQAEAKCQACGGHLASITSPQIHYFLKGLVLPGRDYWIGLSKPDPRVLPKRSGWHWLGGQPYEDLGFWLKGDPTGLAGDKCARLDGGGGYWHDYNCIYDAPYICERGLDYCMASDWSAPVTHTPGKEVLEYLVHFRESLTQPAAEERCRACGGHLASDTSPMVHDFLMGTVHHGRDYWIGLSKPDPLALPKRSGWQWLGGQPYEDLGFWHRRDPTGLAGDKCARLNLNGGYWHDYDCTHFATFICERVSSSLPTTAPTTSVMMDVTTRATKPTSLSTGLDYCKASEWSAPSTQTQGKEVLEYLVHTWEKLTQPEAEERCRACGGHLASDTSSTVHYFLQDKVHPGRDYWIGLSKPDPRVVPKRSGWQWLGGQPYEDLGFWLKGDPTGLAGDKCARLNWDGGYWHDYDCTHLADFICERVSTTLRGSAKVPAGDGMGRPANTSSAGDAYDQATSSTPQETFNQNYLLICVAVLGGVCLAMAVVGALMCGRVCRSPKTPASLPTVAYKHIGVKSVDEEDGHYQNMDEVSPPLARCDGYLDPMSLKKVDY